MIKQIRCNKDYTHTLHNLQPNQCLRKKDTIFSESYYSVKDPYSSTRNSEETVKLDIVKNDITGEYSLSKTLTQPVDITYTVLKTGDNFITTTINDTNFKGVFNPAESIFKVSPNPVVEYTNVTYVFNVTIEKIKS